MQLNTQITARALQTLRRTLKYSRHLISDQQTISPRLLERSAPPQIQYPPVNLQSHQQSIRQKHRDHLLDPQTHPKILSLSLVHTHHQKSQLLAQKTTAIRRPITHIRKSPPMIRPAFIYQKLPQYYKFTIRSIQQTHKKYFKTTTLILITL